MPSLPSDPRCPLRGIIVLLACLLLWPVAGCSSPPAAVQDETAQSPPQDPEDEAALRKALDALPPQRAGIVDLYAVGFAGDASEDVFRNEALYLKTLFNQRFAADGRVVTLINHPDNLTERPYAPLATYDNLYDTLARIGQLMDPDEDALLLFVTTHGTEDHTLYVQVSADEEDWITPKDLRQALDDAGIRNRVIVLSACYSGGFIPALKSPDTMIITAARADRASFGCGNTADATYFGQAWLVDALNQTDDFEQAYRLAVDEIAAREKAEGEPPSMPQVWRGGRIGKVLEHWRAGLHPGAEVPYRVPEPTPSLDNLQAAHLLPSRPLPASNSHFRMPPNEWLHCAAQRASPPASQLPIPSQPAIACQPGSP
ncbi:MAG: C13 family peptidase [Pseudomonas sp.]